MEVKKMHRMRLFLVSMVVLVASATFAGTASAQQQEGLVNLAVTDVNVQVPIGVAANICDVNVGVLAEQEREGGATCDATATSIASAGKGDRDGDVGSGGQQDGLINVLIDDVNVQVPIALAANVCDLNVGVLARQLRTGGADCDADADADATRSPGRSGGNA
jgi:hypothetical protein